MTSESALGSARNVDSPIYSESEKQKWIDTYSCMYGARCIDELEEQIVRQGQAHFHVSGAGHEITAVLAHHLSPSDWLHLHYRDKALLLARGVPAEQFFLSLLARTGSHSDGRQMSAHFSDPHRKILSIVGPVGNNALQAVGVAARIRDEPERAIVLCCVGDGTTQQGEFLEAVSEAVRYSAPVLFLIEDNKFSISTPTVGRTFYDLPTGPAATFLGLEIARTDVARPQEFSDRLANMIAGLRQDRKPRLCVLNVERLSNHTNSDDQTAYRLGSEMAEGVYRDPLKIVRSHLAGFQVGASDVRDLETTVRAKIEAASVYAYKADSPEPTYTTPAPVIGRRKDKPEYTGHANDRSVVMRDAMRGVLAEHLERNPDVVLIGQDIEDPKGDVFGVTKGLSSRFPTRVRNAALSEATIVGTAIGRALAGQRPVAFIQFADFIPLALNQVISELATMSWRTNSGWNVPIVLMVSCGGYKPGLGPFHAQTFEGILAHLPGINVVMPSSAGDASGLLNNALTSDRPTVFLYPKALLNAPDRATSNDLEHHYVPFGLAKLVNEGADLTLVSYGNCLPLCSKVVDILSEAGVFCDLIDLRSIAPWDSQSVIKSVQKTRRIVVVHEDNRTVGFGAEVVSTVVESLDRPIQARRLARADTHIPFNYSNQISVLPSVKGILETCAELVGLKAEWRSLPSNDPFVSVSAIGSGPADEAVVVKEILCSEGQYIKSGVTIAVVEATKAAVEIASPVSGRVHSILCGVEDTIRVGDRILLIEPDEHVREGRDHAQRAGELSPVLRRISPPILWRSVRSAGKGGDVYVSTPAGRTGSRVVPNSEVVAFFPSRTTNEIERLTGIAERRWVASGETVLTMAVDAVRELLERLDLKVSDIDLSIGSTSTPDMTTPSLACRVMAALSNTRNGDHLPAFDINAACSGYLFALAAAYDHIRQFPDANVVVVTSEVLSPLINPEDFQTATIFADAATATLVSGGIRNRAGQTALKLERPLLSGSPETGALLTVPTAGDGKIRMDGRAVFSNSVRAMQRAMISACDAAGLRLDDLSAVIPHQANQRIIDALGSRLSCPLISRIDRIGNTSSSSIPLVLMEALPGLTKNDRIGMVAFGGGFTCAAAIGQVQKEATC
jgi:2-oxoisovalerate dehydrogenase E1 component